MWVIILVRIDIVHDSSKVIHDSRDLVHDSFHVVLHSVNLIHNYIDSWAEVYRSVTVLLIWENSVFRELRKRTVEYVMEYETIHNKVMVVLIVIVWYTLINRDFNKMWTKLYS